MVIWCRAAKVTTSHLTVLWLYFLLSIIWVFVLCLRNSPWCVLVVVSSAYRKWERQLLSFSRHLVARVCAWELSLINQMTSWLQLDDNFWASTIQLNSQILPPTETLWDNKYLLLWDNLLRSNRQLIYSPFSMSRGSVRTFTTLQRYIHHKLYHSPFTSLSSVV